MIKREAAESLKAEITLGLNLGYSDQKIPMQEVINALWESQSVVQEKLQIALSAKVSPCRIVFAGQDEESVTISFINYPKFPVKPGNFREGVEMIASHLMNDLSQNRIVIEFPDETIMLEKSENIDPNIKLG